MATNKELALMINVVIENIERLVQEQDNALTLLGCCSRHRYMDDYVIENERQRLNKNIKISEAKIPKYRDILVDLAAKADEPVTTAAKKNRKPRKVRQNANTKS